MRAPCTNPGLIQPPVALDQLLAAALDSAPFGLIVLHADRSIRLVTAPAAALLGYASSAGRPVLVADFLAGCQALTNASLPVLRATLAGEADPSSGVLLTAHGPSGQRTLSADMRPAGALGWVLSLEDVTSAQQTQDWLLEHASSDPVTGAVEPPAFPADAA